jgi:hypothetical protein
MRAAEGACEVRLTPSSQTDGLLHDERRMNIAYFHLIWCSIDQYKFREMKYIFAFNKRLHTSDLFNSIEVLGQAVTSYKVRWERIVLVSLIMHDGNARDILISQIVDDFCCSS